MFSVNIFFSISQAVWVVKKQKDSKKRPAEIHSHDEFSGSFSVLFRKFRDRITRCKIQRERGLLEGC